MNMHPKLSSPVRLRIGVLMGGRSIENEVSLNSGRTVCDHLDTARYEVIPLFQRTDGTLFLLPLRFLHRGKTTDFVHRLATEATELSWDDLKQKVDFVYIAQHGRYAEDGVLQGCLEVLGIPYSGSKVLASALGMDKIVQKEFLKAAGIDVPRGSYLSVAELLRLRKVSDHERQLFLEDKARAAGFPCIVKPYREGSSLGVSLVRQPGDLAAAVERAATVTPGTVQAVIIEEQLVGMEFTCIVITDTVTNGFRALPATEIVPETAVYEYDQKYMPGRAHKFTPARCSEEIQKKIQEVSIATAQALGITNLGRIDGFVTHDGRIVIIDPNTFSGMAPSSFVFVQAAQVNMSHTQFINHVIQADLRYYKLQHGSDLQQEMADMHTQVATKIRVAVLFGGSSAEREISLESGRNICYKLSPEKYQVLPLFVSERNELFELDQKLLVRNSTAEIAAALGDREPIAWSKLPEVADFVFIGLHGGIGENGAVQGMLEMLKMPYNGSSVLTSALCMDKYKSNNFLRQRGFAVPESLLLSAHDWEEGTLSREKLSEAGLVFPLIVKPHDDGCSVFVQKAKTEIELLDALAAIFAAGRSHALIENCIVGTELTIGVLGNDNPQVLPPSQAIARGSILSIEEKFLPGAGENQTPALLPAEAIKLAQETILAAYKALGCRGYARIDCFYQSAEQSPTGKERVVVLETNTLPGMTPATCIFHQAAEIGMRPMDFVDAIVELGFEEHRNRQITEPAVSDQLFASGVETRVAKQQQ